jgi:molybdopterin converting factor small subunit
VTATSATTATVQVEILAWITRFVGGDGTGRRVLDEPLTAGATVRSVLAGLTTRFPELAAALWHGSELGEHIEVLVNDAVLGIAHTLDSPVKAGDRITLLAQFMGGSHGHLSQATHVGCGLSLR